MLMATHASQLNKKHKLRQPGIPRSADVQASNFDFQVGFNQITESYC